MTAETMLFLLVLSVLGAIAALLGEAGLTRIGVPWRRWPWVASLLLGPVLAGLALLRVFGLLELGGNSSAPASAAAVIELGPLEAMAQSLPHPTGLLQAVLGGVWVVSVALCGFFIARSRVALRRRCRSLGSSRVGTREVLVSPGLGPAVLGVVSPKILLPRWALDLPAPHLRLVLAHEDEHIRARDPFLLGMGLGVVALSPWNPMAWWMLRRLRDAVEMDCDDRVLRRHSDVFTYGQSLLSVAKRVAASPAPLAAFAERPGPLHRRIRSMTRRSPSLRSRTLGSALVLTGIAVGFVACDVPDPTPGSYADPTGPADISDLRMDGPGTPLVYVDGVRADESVIKTLDKVRIARVEVTKGEAAVARFGPEASDGVIEISLREAPDESEGPTESTATTLQEKPTFTPFTQSPSLLNRQEVAEALRAEYPPLLRDAGVGGTVMVWFFIGEDGKVLKTQVEEGSGHVALDQAALRVANGIQFSPALDGDDPVPVWIALPITFQASR